jgi:hypothetical protein
MPKNAMFTRHVESSIIRLNGTRLKGFTTITFLSVSANTSDREGEKNAALPMPTFFTNARLEIFIIFLFLIREDR